MKTFAYQFQVGLLTIFLGGCSYTRNGGGYGNPSPDGKFRIAVAIDGARGHNYADNTKKTIRIGIEGATEVGWTLLYRRAYIFTGSDMQCETHWTGSKSVSVELYDWGDGVGPDRKVKAPTASNHIAMLSFVFNTNTSGFVERH